MIESTHPFQISAVGFKISTCTPTPRGSPRRRRAPRRPSRTSWRGRARLSTGLRRGGGASFTPASPQLHPSFTPASPQLESTRLQSLIVKKGHNRAFNLNRLCPESLRHYVGAVDPAAMPDAVKSALNVPQQVGRVHWAVSCSPPGAGIMLLATSSQTHFRLPSFLELSNFT